jgi:hypothetical protein
MLAVEKDTTLGQPGPGPFSRFRPRLHFPRILQMRPFSPGVTFRKYPSPRPGPRNPGGVFHCPGSISSELPCECHPRAVPVALRYQQALGIGAFCVLHGDERINTVAEAQFEVSSKPVGHTGLNIAA